ncbi:MAG: hypothetical protein HXY34_00240 [Candidatus Thorarchaeota archaeon]|nr:hypothetical protein [Candidatus Thorarchaeota archaeon]
MSVREDAHMRLPDTGEPEVNASALEHLALHKADAMTGPSPSSQAEEEALSSVVNLDDAPTSRCGSSTSGSPIYYRDGRSVCRIDVIDDASR